MKNRSNLQGFDDVNNNSNPFVFKEKHVNSFKNNPISGITLIPWLMIIYKYGKYIDWKKYITRVLFITSLSVFNTLLSTIEYILYEHRINQIQIPDNVIFILGHPRTGTTLIHNLLSTDSNNFYYCNTFMAGFPSSFLWFESIGKYLFKNILDKTRPMDSMPLSFDLPQEDELAILLLNGGISYYMPLYFMSQEPMFRKFLTFKESDGASLIEINAWKSSLTYLIKKIILKQSLIDPNFHKKRLILKSPVHTARLELLRTMFSNAKFIYVHRNPYEILQSASHMADTTYWYSYLNTPTNEQITEFILHQFQQMFEAYNKAVVTKQNKTYRQLHIDTIEISYKSIAYKTIDTLHHIYNHLNIAFNERHFINQVKHLESYKVNNHTNLTDEQKKIINNRWKDYMNTFKYEQS